MAFLPSIWHIAAWLDQVMILAVYGPKGVVDATVSLERQLQCHTGYFAILREV